MKEKKEPDHDIVMLHSPTEDGEGVRALRSRPGRVDLAEIRPLKEGVDVSHNEVISLKPHDDAPFLCDVDTVYSPEEIEDRDKGASPRGGPPKVSSEAFRKNWGQIFKARGGSKKHLLN